MLYWLLYYLKRGVHTSSRVGPTMLSEGAYVLCLNIPAFSPLARSPLPSYAVTPAGGVSRAGAYCLIP